ncbi:MAG: hypothetical protein JWN68_2540 [Nocardioides sp.]|uniref:Ig-like domain-containing protein n=1 Tax=Nocardioides sp. TaxID=35761 RepID=UPI00261EE8C7|nr:Ig-like domain-containing protein [Nocardioides sp.]MCW2834587.1 hypothetical protein [Nocardioides sp.]
MATFAVAAPASAASGSFTNPAPIVLDTSESTGGSNETTIPLGDPTGPASVYPSTIDLTAPAGAEISAVTVFMQGTMLLSDAYGSNSFSNPLQFGTTGPVLADEAASGWCLFSICSNGPVDWDTTTGDSDAFPAPAPAGASDDFDDLFGTSPTGTWSLYAADDTDGSVGSIFGWNLTVSYSVPAEPDPSAVPVSGLPNSITDVSLVLNDIDLPSLNNTELVLESPDGRRAHVLSDAGGEVEGSGSCFPFPFPFCGPFLAGAEVAEPPGDPGDESVTLTLDDEAADPVRRNHLPASGSYQPVNYDDGDPSEFVSGFDTKNLTSSLSTFDGADPNGTWKLYVSQESGSIKGTITGGWSLQITTADATATPVITSPTNGSNDADGTVTVTGTAAAGSLVKVVTGGKTRNTVAEGGAWTVTFGDLADGSHTFTATATDGSGNVSARASVTVTVARPAAPVVSEADTTAPKVRTVKPRKDEDRIAVSASARVRFSEAMDVASVKHAVKLVSAETGKAVDVKLTYKAAKNKVIIDPKHDLERNTTYLVVVTRTAKDLAGNALRKTRTSRFNTL